MDIVAPLVKTGAISETANLIYAVPTGFIFGFGLYHAGFTDARRIARTFYLRDVTVPVTMFSAIVTGMLGLWGLSLIGVLDTSKMYFLPTFLTPMAVGGFIFGVGMALGGYCPGTAVASVATGKIDALVFLIGFLAGSLLFGDLFPVWGDFYNSDYRAVFRLDQLFGIEVGQAVLAIVVVAIAAGIMLRAGQRRFWARGAPMAVELDQELRWEVPLVVLALLLAVVLAFFPTSAFLAETEPGYYIVPKQRVGTIPPAVPVRPSAQAAAPEEFRAKTPGRVATIGARQATGPAEYGYGSGSPESADPGCPRFPAWAAMRCNGGSGSA